MFRKGRLVITVISCCCDCRNFGVIPKKNHPNQGTPVCNHVIFDEPKLVMDEMIISEFCPLPKGEMEY